MKFQASSGACQVYIIIIKNYNYVVLVPVRHISKSAEIIHIKITYHHVK